MNTIEAIQAEIEARAKANPFSQMKPVKEARGMPASEYWTKRADALAHEAKRVQQNLLTPNLL